MSKDVDTLGIKTMMTMMGEYPTVRMPLYSNCLNLSELKFSDEDLYSFIEIQQMFIECLLSTSSLVLKGKQNIKIHYSDKE